MRSVDQRYHPHLYGPMDGFSTDRISKFTLGLTNSIGDQGATHLGSMLRTNTSLTHLDLDAVLAHEAEKDKIQKKTSAITCDGAVRKVSKEN